MPGTPPGGFMGLPVRALGVDPAGAVTLYAGTNGRGVFKRLPPNNLGGVQATLWCGSDSPLPCADSSGLTALRAQSAAVGLRAGAKAVFGGLVGGGVITSVDNGATWRPTPDPEPTARSVFGFAVDPTDQSVVYAATGQGVILTENGGDSWTVASAGLPRDAFVNVLGPGPFRMVRFHLVHPANPLVLYAGVKAGPASLLLGGIDGSVDGRVLDGLNSAWPTAATTTGRASCPPSPSTTVRGPAHGARSTPRSRRPRETSARPRHVECSKSIDGAGTWTPMNGGSRSARICPSRAGNRSLAAANLYAATTTGQAFSS